MTVIIITIEVSVSIGAIADILVHCIITYTAILAEDALLGYMPLKDKASIIDRWRALSNPLNVVPKCL